jgi:3-oxoacyl-[acyl-carrier protein] reductase
MARELEGKRALVTGSSNGLGMAIAKRLAREGARLVVHGRNIERAERVAADIRAEGGEAHVAIGDLMLDDQASAVADTAEATLGGIDILVNNAGGESAGHGQASFFDAKPEEWLKTYNGNVVCAIRLIQRFAPGMKAAGWGRIIQISSLVSHRPNLVIPRLCGSEGRAQQYDGRPVAGVGRHRRHGQLDQPRRDPHRRRRGLVPQAVRAVRLGRRLG